MSVFPAWLTRKRHRSRAIAITAVSRHGRFESLEPRLALATLGLGIRVFSDDGGMPSSELTAPLEVGQDFWIQVATQDQRDDPQGIVSLPLNLFWDTDDVQLLNLPTSFFPNPVLPAELVTPDFPLNRFVDSYVPNAGPFNPSIVNLRGASLPLAGTGQAIGIAPNFGFSLLHFKALAVADDSPFTIQLAGSMSFADADVLDGVNSLLPPVLQVRDATETPIVSGPQGPELAVTEFLEIVEIPPPEPGSISLSGFVYADTNLNGVFDSNAAGTPLEIGLPNVTIRLFRTDQGANAPAIATTTTGPDGWYHFEDLEAGTYRVVETQPPQFVNSLNSLGTIIASPAGGGSNPPNAAARRGNVGNNQFTEITLRGGEQGVNYNFGENVIPTKRDLRSRSLPRVALPETLGVKTVVVNGTAGSDNIVVQTFSDEIQVTVNNGVPLFFLRSDVGLLLIDAQAGDDTVSMLGDDGNNLAHLLPGQSSMRFGSDYLGLNFAVLVRNVEHTTVDAGTTGADLAVFEDTRGVSDALVATGSNATLSNTAERIDQAIGFDRVRGVTFDTTGGSEVDMVDVNAHDYALEFVGDWTEI